MNEQAAEVLKHIADKLDLPVETLWAGLVAYAPFTFWQWVVGVVIGTIASIVLWMLCWKAPAENNPNNMPRAFMWGVLAAVVTAILFINGHAQMPDALAAKYAPEAWAAKHIIERIRK